jgi:hypothetical protein
MILTPFPVSFITLTPFPVSLITLTPFPVSPKGEKLPPPWGRVGEGVFFYTGLREGIFLPAGEGGKYYISKVTKR